MTGRPLAATGSIDVNCNIEPLACQVNYSGRQTVADGEESPLWGSNPRPYAYEAHALPTELRRHMSVTFDCYNRQASANLRLGAREGSWRQVGARARRCQAQRRLHA